MRRRLKEDVEASIVFYGDDTWVKLFASSPPQGASSDAFPEDQDEDHGLARPPHHHPTHSPPQHVTDTPGVASPPFLRVDGTTSFFTKAWGWG